MGFVGGEFFEAVFEGEFFVGFEVCGEIGEGVVFEEGADGELLVDYKRFKQNVTSSLKMSSIKMLSLKFTGISTQKTSFHSENIRNFQLLK